MQQHAATFLFPFVYSLDLFMNCEYNFIVCNILYN